ncbi:MAG TPA: hypothetical protein VIV58_12610 [Kofleriaceae bacterium]
MSTDDQDKDVRVKQLLDGNASLDDVVDAATQAELQRWFALPSFEQVEQQAAPVDAELEEAKERRAKATAAVDPGLLASIHHRTEVQPETLLRYTWHLDIHVDPTIAQFDQAMAERGHQIAEPREVEISDELKDDLKECTPQALLRDLHRPELTFEKTFEWVDMAADQKLDIVAEVEQAMRTSLKLPPLGLSPFEEERRLLLEDRATRRKPWTELVRKDKPVLGVERTRES